MNTRNRTNRFVMKFQLHLLAICLSGCSTYNEHYFSGKIRDRDASRQVRSLDFDLGRSERQDGRFNQFFFSDEWNRVLRVSLEDIDDYGDATMSSNDAREISIADRDDYGKLRDGAFMRLYGSIAVSGTRSKNRITMDVASRDGQVQLAGVLNPETKIDFQPVAAFALMTGLYIGATINPEVIEQDAPSNR